jgi:hypothetical protein
MKNKMGGLMRPLALFLALNAVSSVAAAEPTLKGFKYGGAWKPSGAPFSGVTGQFSDKTRMTFSVQTGTRGCFKVALAVQSGEPLVGQIDFGGMRERLVQDDKTGLLLQEKEMCANAYSPAETASIIVRRQSGDTSQPLELQATAQMFKAPYGKAQEAATERAVREHDRNFTKRNRGKVCAECRFQPDSCLIRNGMTRADCH